MYLSSFDLKSSIVIGKVTIIINVAVLDESEAAQKVPFPVYPA